MLNNSKGKISIVLALTIFIILFTSFIILYPRPWGSYTSPNNKNTLSIRYVNSIFFGPQKIIIKSRKNSLFHYLNTKSYTTYIDNDGKLLLDHNIQVKWMDNNTAEIKLTGKNQKTQRLLVTFDKAITYKQERE